MRRGLFRSNTRFAGRTRCNKTMGRPLAPGAEPGFIAQGKLIWPRIRRSVTVAANILIAPTFPARSSFL